MLLFLIVQIGSQSITIVIIRFLCHYVIQYLTPRVYVAKVDLILSTESSHIGMVYVVQKKVPKQACAF